ALPILMINEDVMLYRDSNMVINQEPLEESMRATVSLVYPELDIVKLVSENQTSWAKLSDLEYSTDHLEKKSDLLQENFVQMQIKDRKRTKSIIESLLKRQIELENTADQAVNRLERVENLYNKLKNSNIGKIHVHNM